MVWAFGIFGYRKVEVEVADGGSSQLLQRLRWRQLLQVCALHLLCSPFRVLSDELAHPGRACCCSVHAAKDGLPQWREGCVLYRVVRACWTVLESYLAAHPGRVPWVACGRSAST